MSPNAPAALDSAALSRRLGELAGDERQVLVEFLHYLDEFDIRRAYLELGYDSLWAYCQRALHLREGPTALRITAMRALRRFPALAEPLRDGRLCLTTVRLLEPILNDDNVGELIARASFLSKADTERLAVSIQPRSAPKDGVRKLPERSQAPSEVALLPATSPPCDPRPLPDTTSSATNDARQVEAPPAPVHVPRSRAKVEPVTEDSYSLRVTVDAAFKAELDQLKALLSHKIPNGELGAVLQEAVRCAIEKHGKRKGAVEPKKKRAPVTERVAAGGRPGTERSAIPIEIRRQVWKRDEGRCTWRGRDGRRCDSTWRLEVDHIHPVALGGLSTMSNTRLLCAGHNTLHAEQTYGREHMTQFRSETPRTSEVTESRLRGGPGEYSAQQCLIRT